MLALISLFFFFFWQPAPAVSLSLLPGHRLVNGLPPLPSCITLLSFSSSHFPGSSPNSEGSGFLCRAAATGLRWYTTENSQLILAPCGVRASPSHCLSKEKSIIETPMASPTQFLESVPS